MLQLRLRQHPAGEGRHRVDITLVEGDGAPRTAESTFAFSLSAQDEEDLRWYLEDFLQYPQDPAPAIARRIEKRIAELGTELFAAVFQGSDDARDLWALLRDRLAETRVEIATGIAEASSILWELLRDPQTDRPLALSAQSFVRAQPNAVFHPRLPAPPVKTDREEKFRILLVLCRPNGAVDVPFRSVANRLVKGLDEAARAAHDLDLLRPPTFAQLGKVLRRAKAAGRPYHVVHFDGHGTYLDTTPPAGLTGLMKGLSSLVLSLPRPGRHGFLLFENPELDENFELVDGTSLGKLLAEAQVPVLVLNACRSAHAEPAAQPQVAADPHSQVRAFGSFAQEVMDAGAAGVVAMRYNVYVVTAAQLVSELYASLGRGVTLGEAVTLARKNLAASPLREIAFAPLALQDWTVPIVYEAAPMRLFPEMEGHGGGGEKKIQVKEGEAAGSSAQEGALDPDLPAPPDAGFFGRDETLLALDRAFDRDSVVLLHAYAGSGKTTIAAEFARWYSLTGGVEGPVLFTSFERYLPLPRVLDRVGQFFGAALGGAGVHWLALDDDRRREVALQVLAQIPVLWVWDNVEPVTGFPAGTSSAWSDEEQRELVAFLRAAKGTKARFLLTSRRDEHAWLGALPTRVVVPAMPLTESLQLARALAEKHGRRLSDIADWRPLLYFAQGSPLAVTVLVGEALRQKLDSAGKIEEFVAHLRSGEAKFPDEQGEGRSRSLGASLAYGFESAFSEEERHKLALLHLFQGFVDVTALRLMGDPEDPWCLPEVRGITREEGIALLDRAAEVGLLTGHGGGYYSIHPALPWFFHSLFEKTYPEGGLPALRAFVEALGELGNFYHRQYEGGNRDVLGALRAEEANLLHARRLARAHDWWDPVTSAMQGLRQLYGHTGRRAEWKRLVEEIVPDFVDPENDSPLPGCEEEWGLITEYRVQLAEEEQRWDEAGQLQMVRVEWDRRHAASILARPVEELQPSEKNTIRTLAGSLHTLGQILRELGRQDCVPVFEQSLELTERIGDRTGSAVCSFNLGQAFENLPTIRDFDQAERWYRKSLDHRVGPDSLGRGRCLAQLGSVSLRRFQLANFGRPAENVLLRYLNEAANFCHEALSLLPVDAVDDLARIHQQLGIIYGEAGDQDRALPHYRQALQGYEQIGDIFAATKLRVNISILLLACERRADALEYARAAHRTYESFGSRTRAETEQLSGLIQQIIEPSPSRETQIDSGAPFDTLIMDLVTSGLPREAIAVCEQELANRKSSLITVAKIRRAQLMLLLDRGAEVSNIALELGQHYPRGDSAAISFAAFLAARFTAGAPIPLAESARLFGATYGPEALKYALQLSAYRLELVLWKKAPQHKVPESLSSNHLSSPPLYHQLAAAAEALTIFDPQTTIGILEQISLSKTTSTVSTLVSRFLIAKARLALGDVSAALSMASSLYAEVRSTGLDSLRHQIAFFAASVASSEAVAERRPQENHGSEDSPLSSSATYPFQDDLRELARSPVLCLSTIRANLYLGILEGSLDLLSTSVEGYRQLLTWVIGLRTLLQPYLSTIDSSTERLAHRMLFPSLTPDLSPKQQHSGSLLFDNLTSNFHCLDLKGEALIGLLFLSFFYESRKSFREAAACWDEFLLVDAETPDLSLDLGLNRSPLVAQGRLLRLAGDQQLAAEMLDKAEQLERSSMINIHPLMSAYLCKERALIEIGRENLRGALSLFRDAVRYARETPTYLLAQLLYLKGCLELRMGSVRWRNTLEEVCGMNIAGMSPEIQRFQILARKVITRIDAQ